jgi:hypothetical protein
MLACDNSKRGRKIHEYGTHSLPHHSITHISAHQVADVRDDKFKRRCRAAALYALSASAAWFSSIANSPGILYFVWTDRRQIDSSLIMLTPTPGWLLSCPYEALIAFTLSFN